MVNDGEESSGWWLTYPSEKYESQLGLSFLIYVKNKKCSKPPTGYDNIWIYYGNNGFTMD